VIVFAVKPVQSALRSLSFICKSPSPIPRLTRSDRKCCSTAPHQCLRTKTVASPIPCTSRPVHCTDSASPSFVMPCSQSTCLHEALVRITQTQRDAVCMTTSIFRSFVCLSLFHCFPAKKSRSKQAAQKACESIGSCTYCRSCFVHLLQQKRLSSQSPKSSLARSIRRHLVPLRNARQLPLPVLLSRFLLLFLPLLSISLSRSVFYSGFRFLDSSPAFSSMNLHFHHLPPFTSS
jgi:hypothetical protein